MKKLFTLLFTILLSIQVFSQINDFKIGVVSWGDVSFSKDVNKDIITSPKIGSEYSSVYGVYKNDGVNIIRTYEPTCNDWDDWTKKKTEDYYTLIINNGLKLMVQNAYWFKLDQNDPTNTNKTTLQWNNFDVNTYDSYFLNYDYTFHNLYNREPFKSNIWGTDLIGEYQTGMYPFESVRPLRWFANDGYEAYWAHMIIPKESASAGFSHFSTLKTSTIPNLKLINAPGAHGYKLEGHIMDNQENMSDYITMQNRGDVCYEAGYFSKWILYAYNNIHMSNRDRGLYKFDNIDFCQNYFNEVHTEIDVQNYDHLDSITNWHLKYTTSTNPSSPNFNNLWFKTYTAIIHGINGVWFYHPLNMYSESAIDNVNKTNLENKDFSKDNFPDNYKNFLAPLIQELAYLVKKNLLSTESSSILYSKTSNSDPNGILKPCGNYIPQTLTSENSSDLINFRIENNLYEQTFGSTEITFPMQNLDWDNEKFGIRYTIRTNGTEVVMILSNPNPIQISGVELDFNNISNPIIRNSNYVDVLFEDNSLQPTNLNYKTDRNSTVNLSALTVGKSYPIPLVNRKCTLSFGPLDVHILKFRNSTNTPPAQGYNNGWDKVWSNNGSGNIEDWHIRDYDQKIAGDFDGDGNEELLMIQTPDIGNFNYSWANMYKYENGKWNRNWSNNGNDRIGTTSYWTIGQYDHFYIGNFVKETTGDRKDELLIIQQDPSYSNGGGKAGLYSFNNGSWTQVWGTTTGVLGWWGFKKDDKYIVGNFDNDVDNIDDLLSIQSSYYPRNWSQIHTYNSTTGSWNNLYSNDNSGVSTGNLGVWNIGNTDQFIAGKFNGSADRSYLLCFDGDGLTNRMLKFNPVTRQWDNTPYSNSSGSIGGISANPISLTHKYLVGDIDNVDTKDEFFHIQRGTNANWAVSIDLKSSLSSWNWNWSASNGSNPYVDDWSINDQGGLNTDYLLIKADSSDPKYLLAFRSFGTNNNFIASMYKSMSGTNKSAQMVNSEDNFNNNNDLHIYPNPASNNLVLESKNSEQRNYTVTLTNIQGQEIYSESIVFENCYNLDITSIDNGIYFLTLKNNKEKIVKKFVVQK